MIMIFARPFHTYRVIKVNGIDRCVIFLIIHNMPVNYSDDVYCTCLSKALITS